MVAEAERAAFASTLSDAWLTMAQLRRSVAGPTLTVYRIAGAANELTARPSPAAVGTVSGYVYSPSRQRIETPPAPDFTPTDTYVFVSATAAITPPVTPARVVEGDTLVDPDDLTVGYQVQGVEPITGPFVARVAKGPFTVPA